MSVFQVTQVKGQLHRLFDAVIDVSDMPENQSENSFLSRSLAAYALVQLAGADPAVAAASVTDGFDDNGIDAVYYDPRERRLFLIQSKWMHGGTGEPDLGDVNKFAAGVRDLLNLSFDRFNEKVRLQQDLVMEVSREPSTKVTAVLAYTSTKRELAEHGSRVLNDLVTDVNEGGELLDPIILWPLPSIHQTLSALAAGTPINLEVGVRSWGKVHDPFLAYYGQVNGNEIASWGLGRWGRVFKTHGSCVLPRNRGIGDRSSIFDQRWGQIRDRDRSSKLRDPASCPPTVDLAGHFVPISSIPRRFERELSPLSRLVSRTEVASVLRWQGSQDSSMPARFIM